MTIMKNKIHNYILGVLTLMMVVFPFQAGAAVTLLDGDKISIEADDVVNGDYYVSVGPLGTTVMSGEVEGDMYSLAGSVTANGTIGGDFGSIGGLSYMHASVTDDVRIVAGEAVIDHEVGGDVFVVAGVLKILSTAKIAGDVVFYGGEGEIAGEIGGSIYGSATTVRIDGKVAKDVDITASRGLTLGSKADVAGNVSYRSTTDLKRAQESHVGGEVQKKQIDNQVDAVDTVRAFFIPLFVSLFATLTLYLLFKKEIITIVTVLNERPLTSGLLGLATIATGPFVSLLLISTVLGMLLGVFGIGFMLLLFAAGFSVAIVFVGALISKFMTNKVTVSLTSILMGALVFHSLFFIPVIGFLVAFAVLAMAIGGIVLVLYRKMT